MRYPKYWSRVSYRDWYEAENKMWGCLSDKNAICEIDKVTKKVRVLGHYPQRRLAESELSATVIGVYEKIVFVPLAADDIAVYDRTSDELIFIPIRKNHEKRHEIYQEHMKFRRAFVYKDDIFLLGYSYPAILQFNINTLEIRYLTEWVDMIEPYIEKGDNLGYFKEGCSFYGAQVYLPLGCCSGLMKIELEKMQYEYIHINAGTHGFGSLTDHNGTFYMTGRSGKEREVIIWNKYSKSIRKIQIPVAYYYAPIVYNENVFLFSFNGSGVIQLKEDSDSFKEYKFPEAFVSEKNTLDLHVITVKCSGKKLVFQMGGSRKWYEVDLDSKIINESVYCLENEQFLSQSWSEYCDVKIKQLLKEKICTEILPMEEYLTRIANMENKNDIQKKHSDTNGSFIWSYLKMLG